MTLSLAPGVSFCDVDGGRVFLDLNHDRYFSLGRVADPAFDALVRGRGPSDAELHRLEALADAGILVRDPFGEAPRACRVVRIERAPLDQDLAVDLRTMRVVRSAIAFRLAKSVYRRRGLPDVWQRFRREKDMRLSALRAGTPAELDELAYRFDAVARMVGALNHCVPFSLAIAGACLASGLKANLVLGVKLAPFQAHAWAVAGHTLISDRLPTVSQFTPIAIA